MGGGGRKLLTYSTIVFVRKTMHTSTRFLLEVVCAAVVVALLLLLSVLLAFVLVLVLLHCCG